MDADDLTVTTVRDGAVCTLILCGDLDLDAAGEFLQRAARVLDDRIERLVLDLAGVTFLDCAGVRALAMAASFALSGCPVIIRSLSPMARRILELLDLDVKSIRQASPAPRTTRGTWARQPVRRHLALPEPGRARGHGR